MREEYSFEPFRRELDRNWFDDDGLLGALLRRYAGTVPRDEAGREGEVRPDEDGGPGEAARALSRWGGECAGRLRRLAEESARPENRPRLRRHDGHGRRVDEVVLPGSTREALDVAEGREGLGAVDGDPFLHYARVYLYGQNGEGGVACSVACTDGLVRVLEAAGDRREHEAALREVRGSRPGRVVHGAQFVTEIQGGSDVRANRTRAVRDGDVFRLYGRKWFCSNVNADHYLVTARPEESDGEAPVALYLVRAREPADPDGETPGPPPRNGHTVDRLKEKMGTRELATAVVSFDGARAVPVGPPRRGLRLLLRHVLVPSRFGCVLFAASTLRRAERTAGAYAEFRTAFGRPIGAYPRVRAALDALRRERARALSAAFRLLELWERVRAAPGWTDPEGVPAAERTEALDFRVMLSLCKAELTRRSTRGLHEATMVLGGNGLMEDFSPLPRLYRDSVIMEAWEGPRNVLLAQALRDLRRFGAEPGAFVDRIAGGARESRGEEEPTGRGAEPVGELADRLSEVLEGDPPEPPTVAFGEVAGRLVTAFAEAGLPGAGELGEA